MYQMVASTSWLLSANRSTFPAHDFLLPMEFWFNRSKSFLQVNRSTSACMKKKYLEPFVDAKWAAGNLTNELKWCSRASQAQYRWVKLPFLKPALRLLFDYDCILFRFLPSPETNPAALNALCMWLVIIMLICLSSSKHKAHKWPLVSCTK